jgi:ankyrin repeat protein
MSICTLATELVLLLAECLDDSSLNGLARACRTLYDLLDPFLYARHAKLGFGKPLTWALMAVRPGTVTRLLDLGMDINSVSLDLGFYTEHSQPLTLAINRWAHAGVIRPRFSLRDVHHLVDVEDRSHISMIRLLLERGALFSVMDARDLFFIAIATGLVEVAHLTLTHGGSLGLAAGKIADAVMAEAALGDLEILRMLLDHGFPVQPGPNSFRQTPLFLAVCKGRVAAARLLLERGSRVQATITSSPLHQVLLEQTVPGSDCLEIVRMLVDHGADVNSCPTSILMAALRRNDDAIIDFLIESGADIHWRNPFGTRWDGPTFLHKAVNGSGGVGPYGILKLAELGVDLEVRDDDGKTALHYAVDNYSDLARLAALLTLPVDIEARTGAGWTAMHLAASRRESPEAIKMLVAAGADINARTTPDGSTPLHLVISRWNAPEFYQELVDAGADINAQRSSDGSSVVHLAVSSWESPDLIEMLVNAGADINLQTSNGSTALHLATHLRRQPIVDALLRLGADAGIQDHDGKTALDIFKDFPRPSRELAKIGKLLLENSDANSTPSQSEATEEKATGGVTIAAKKKALAKKEQSEKTLKMKATVKNEQSEERGKTVKRKRSTTTKKTATGGLSCPPPARYRTRATAKQEPR